MMRLTKKKKKTQTQILLTAFSTVKRTQNFAAKAIAQVMASPLPISDARSHQVPIFSLSQVKNVLLGLFTFTHYVCVCLCVCILSHLIGSPGINRLQHLSNTDQADLSLFLSQTHCT